VAPIKTGRQQKKKPFIALSPAAHHRDFFLRLLPRRCHPHRSDREKGNAGLFFCLVFRAQRKIKKMQKSEPFFQFYLTSNTKNVKKKI